MKWWFSSWNLLLFSLSKVCRISSADCFISGFTASQSTLFCGAKYSVPHFAQWLSVLLRLFLKVFLYVLHWKILLKKHFQLVSDFIFLPPSFCFTFSFCSYESPKDKLSLYLYWKVSISLRGCFAKVFYPLTIIGKLRAVCWGISRKFYKKIAEKFSRQPHIKRKSDITQTSFFDYYIYLQFFFTDKIRASCLSYYLSSLKLL